MYDVIIIGAGPTGSSAAKELADHGCKVLIVEKHKMPRNKSCSGILIQKSLQLVRTYFGEDIPHAATCTPSDSRGMVFTNDVGREYRYEQDGLNIWRSAFDYWLAQKAVDAGAELKDATAAIQCAERNECVEVTLKDGEEYVEQAKMVIACDGAVGSIKRKLLDTPKNYITTWQTFCTGSIDLDYHYFYAYLQPELSEYDAWFNVKDDYLIFGVSVKDKSRIGHYYTKFIDYMKREHNAKIERQIKTERWIMPCVMPGCPIDYGKGRVLFAGEAAGFLNPMGEGISAGMESGHCAASSIANHFDNLETIYADYRQRTQGLKNYMERRGVSLHEWQILLKE